MSFQGEILHPEAGTSRAAKQAEYLAEARVQAEDAVWEEIPNTDSLDLGNIAHLNHFLESAEDVFADTAQYEVFALADADGLADTEFEGEIIKGDKVFDELHNTLEHIQEHVDSLRYTDAPAEGYSEQDRIIHTNQDVEKLQNLYNKLITLRNFVSGKYSDQIIDSTENLGEQVESLVPAQDESVAKTTNEKKDHPVAESVSEKEGNSTELLIQDYKDRIETQWQDVRHLHDSLHGAFPIEKRGPKESELLKKIKGYFTQASELRTKADEVSEVFSVNPQADLERYLAQVKKVRAEAVVYVTELKDTHDEEYAETLPQTANNASRGIVLNEPAQPLVSTEEQWVDTRNTSPEEKVADSVSLDQTFPEDATESLQVCGMTLPSAGPNGVFGARSFRDGLELVRRTHPELKDVPEKQALVDQIIRILFVVPDAGLTAEQVVRVTELAKELDVSENVVDARRQAAAKASEDMSDDVSGGQHDSEKEWVVEGKTEAEIAEHYRKENLNYWRHKTTQVLKNRGEWSESDEVETAEGGGYLSKKMRGLMDIVFDRDGEGEVKIKTTAPGGAQAVEETVRDASDFETESIQTIADSEVGESDKTINNSIPTEEERAAKRAESKQADTLTGKYLVRNPKYTEFLAKTYETPGQFEKILKAAITQIDNKAVDSLERWLDRDNPHQSPFAFLQDKKLSEIEKLNGLPAAERKAELADQNIKYEAYLAWMDTYADMAKVVTLTPDMTFGEVFAQWMIETEMTYYEGHTSASQFTA